VKNLTYFSFLSSEGFGSDVSNKKENYDEQLQLFKLNWEIFTSSKPYGSEDDAT
jgi:hypothetical protein